MGLASFVASKTYKNFMSKVYGWGAAIVIMGALFKINHYTGADYMLIVGLSPKQRSSFSQHLSLLMLNLTGAWFILNLQECTMAAPVLPELHHISCHIKQLPGVGRYAYKIQNWSRTD